MQTLARSQEKETSQGRYSYSYHSCPLLSIAVKQEDVKLSSIAETQMLGSVIMFHAHDHQPNLRQIVLCHYRVKSKFFSSYKSTSCIPFYQQGIAGGKQLSSAASLDYQIDSIPGILMAAIVGPYRTFIFELGSFRRPQQK
ncbi:hypothetical protein O6H91_04G113700 [Diphasiastrum complanatum]|uniref:Uncharacterized protein n=1 Tax=Diphasiastrum complanatum TaxID=34168 RepID=A0ACC2E0X5_DIPCM|nr:hypothetical protein O6H91_04G113700 [Diphasiastrum complanatum]